MIGSHELKKRDRYLKKLISFQDTEPVKVITGIRRCGKSSLLKLMVAHLKEIGVAPEHIVEMNFESHDFRNMTSDDVYDYVKERTVPGKRMYFFLMSCKELRNGRTPSTLFVWTWIAISMSQGQMLIFFHQNTPPISPDGAWK